MKTLKITFLLVTFLAAMQVNAQTSIQSFESTVDHNETQRPCIQINLDPEPKTLKNAWREYLKNNYDLKLKGIGFLSNKDLLSAEAVMVKQISSKEMDFYTHITEDVNGSEMKVFLRFGYDIYLTKEKNPIEYEALSEILDSFLKYYLPKYYSGKINDTKKRVEKLKDETRDLEKEIVRDSARIVKLKEDLEGVEEELGANNERLAIAKKKLIKRSEKLVRIRKRLREM